MREKRRKGIVKLGRKQKIRKKKEKKKRKKLKGGRRYIIP